MKHHLSIKDLEKIAAEFCTLSCMMKNSWKGKTSTKHFHGTKGFKIFLYVSYSNPSYFENSPRGRLWCDVSSCVELWWVINWISGSEIMLSSNNTPDKRNTPMRELGELINLDAFEDIEHLERTAGIRNISCRYNPSEAFFELNEHYGQSWKPSLVWPRPALWSFAILKEKAPRLWNSLLPASNVLHLIIQSCSISFWIRLKIIKGKVGHFLRLYQSSGGIGILSSDQSKWYRLDWREGFMQVLWRSSTPVGLRQSIFAELGRFYASPHGALVTSDSWEKTYCTYLGVDASAVNLMRQPCMESPSYN